MIRRSFIPELISMNAMMAADDGGRDTADDGAGLRAMQPTELLFWGVMSLGVIAGFSLAVSVQCMAGCQGSQTWADDRAYRRGPRQKRDQGEQKCEREKATQTRGSRRPFDARDGARCARTRIAARAR